MMLLQLALFHICHSAVTSGQVLLLQVRMVLMRAAD